MPTVAKGLTHCWVVSDLIFSLLFFCIGSMQVVKNAPYFLPFVEKFRGQFEQIKVAKNASVSSKTASVELKDF